MKWSLVRSTFGPRGISRGYEEQEDGAREPGAFSRIISGTRQIGLR